MVTGTGTIGVVVAVIEIVAARQAKLARLGGCETAGVGRLSAALALHPPHSAPGRWENSRAKELSEADSKTARAAAHGRDMEAVAEMGDRGHPQAHRRTLCVEGA